MAERRWDSGKGCGEERKPPIDINCKDELLSKPPYGLRSLLILAFLFLMKFIDIWSHGQKPPETLVSSSFFGDDKFWSLCMFFPFSLIFSSSSLSFAPFLLSLKLPSGFCSTNWVERPSETGGPKVTHLQRLRSIRLFMKSKSLWQTPRGLGVFFFSCIAPENLPAEVKNRLYFELN